MGVYKRIYPIIRLLFGLTIIVGQFMGVTGNVVAAEPQVSNACVPFSDDFTGSTLDSGWEFVEPDLASDYTLTGDNVEISVPSGSAHEFWKNQFNPPRLMQAIGNTDFGVEVKFDSVPSQKYQEQGIAVREAANSYLRFDTYSDGSVIRVFTVYVVGGTTSQVNSTVATVTPSYLRVTRSGNNWTYQYSDDGISWITAATFTQSFTATHVGVYGGNAGPSPAYTASVDYFSSLEKGCYIGNNNPPQVTNPGTQTNNENDTVSLSIVASDVEDDPLVYSATGLPTGLDIDDSTGEISGTISTGAAGTYNTEVTVSDGLNESPVAFTWEVGDGVVVCKPFSDNFYDSVLPGSASWEFVDPAGDSTLTLTGTNAEIHIPAGSSHEFWSGIKNAPHYVQQVGDIDFIVEVKFESTPSGFAQEQGILVKESGTVVIRNEIYSTDSEVRVFAALVSGSSTTKFVEQAISPVPQYLRLERSGDDFTLSTSTNGTDWIVATSYTQAIDMEYLGFYGGTAGGGGAPEFTASADYFMNLASGCTVEDTDVSDPTPPTIDFWYGDSQSFGDQGNPQQWVNILGRVEDDNGVSSLSYSLNSGSDVGVTVGPDGKRLLDNGDFNIEIDQADLIDSSSGSNTLEVTATDSLGASTTETMTIDYYDGNVWPLPYTADWSSGITDAGQIVDGLWEQVTDGVRTSATGYDRLIAIGDETWTTDYEVTVPITIHSASNGSGVGLAVGWQGHTGSDSPRTQWPLQAIGWVRNFPANPELRILTYPGTVETSADRSDLSVDTTYMLKVRSSEITAGTSRVSVKLWEQGESEPSAWEISADVASRDGSVLLIAHRADVTFGNVEIDELSDVVEIGDLTLDLEVDERITEFQVQFTQKVYDPDGDDEEDDVTNPDNYILFGPGLNATFDTSACTDATPPDQVLPDDEQIVVNSVTYDEATMTSTVQINDGNTLPKGNYRLLVCGSTSIVDLFGTPINNGVDFLYDFTVLAPSGGGGGGGGGAGRNGGLADPDSLSKFALPHTGFTPGVVTELPLQPADKTYEEMDGIWLEIPSLGVKTQVMGIPLGEDGWDVTWLGDNVGYLDGTAFPTWAGNTVITAHVWDANNNPGPFAALKDLQYGDEFYLYAFGQKYVYQVRIVDTVHPYKTYSVMRHEDLDWVTLLTCEGYNLSSDSYLARRIVRAVLVSVE